MPKFEPSPTVTQDEVPANLKPFLFHRLDIKWTGGEEATGTCIFCGRDNKLYINTPTGKWNCRVCGKSGNATTFLRELYAASVESGSNYEELAADRKLEPKTLEAWGLVQSVVDGEWLLPGFTRRDNEVLVKTLYRYSFSGKKRSLLVTSGFEHCLIGMQFYDPSKPEIHLVEGPWNVMAWDEEHQRSTEQRPNIKNRNLLSIPGASTFKESWVPYFQGKRVTIICDSDHPKRSCKNCKKSYSTIDHQACPKCGSTVGRPVAPAGYNGARSIARILKGSATQISVFSWGKDGYDATKPSGYDLRDLITNNGSN